MMADMSRDRSYIQRRAEVAVKRLAKELRHKLNQAHDFVSVDESVVLKEAHARGLQAENIDELAALPLAKRDALATTFIQSAKIWSAGEGASLGAAGIVSVPADVVALVATNLRMVQSIAAAYGMRLDTPNGRVHAWVPLLEVLGAEEVPVEWYEGPKAPPRSALTTIANRIARAFASRLVKQDKARAVPLVGAVAGGVSNYAFTNQVGASAKQHFRARADVTAEEPESSTRSAPRKRAPSKPSSRA